MMIRCIIVDDEKHASDALGWKLQESGFEVEVVRTYRNPVEALQKIPTIDFHLLFLDIQMPVMTGFELLEALDQKDFSVIFVTAHDEHILEALRASALDYLLKPVAIDELRKALTRFSLTRNSNMFAERFSQFQVEQARLSSGRVALATSESIQFVDRSKILYCQSHSNYTTIHIDDGEKVLLSKALKQVEDILGAGFVRVHNSFLVNLSSVKAYMRGAGGSLEMIDGTIVPVSRKRKEEVLARLNLS